MMTSQVRDPGNEGSAGPSYLSIDRMRKDMQTNFSLVPTAFFLLNKYIKESNKVVSEILRSQQHFQAGLEGGQQVEQDLNTITIQLTSLQEVISHFQNRVQPASGSINCKLDSCLNQHELQRKQRLESRRNIQQSSLHQDCSQSIHQSLPRNNVLHVANNGSVCETGRILVQQEHCLTDFSMVPNLYQTSQTTARVVSIAPQVALQDPRLSQQPVHYVSPQPQQQMLTFSGSHLNNMGPPPPLIHRDHIPLMTQSSVVCPPTREGYSIAVPVTSMVSQSMTRPSISASIDRNRIALRSRKDRVRPPLILPSSSQRSASLNQSSDRQTSNRSNKEFIAPTTSFYRKSHNNLSDQILEESLFCHFCSLKKEQYVSKAQLLQHIKTEHKEKMDIYDQVFSLNPSVENNAMIRGNVTCFYCSFRERSKAPLFRHIQEKHLDHYQVFQFMANLNNIKSPLPRVTMTSTTNISSPKKTVVSIRTTKGPTIMEMAKPSSSTEKPSTEDALEKCLEIRRVPAKFSPVKTRSNTRRCLPSVFPNKLRTSSPASSAASSTKSPVLSVKSLESGTKTRKASNGTSSLDSACNGSENEDDEETVCESNPRKRRNEMSDTEDTSCLKLRRTRKVQAELNKQRHSCPLCPSHFSSKNALALHTEFYCKERPLEQVERTRNLRPCLPLASKPGPASSKEGSIKHRLRSRSLSATSSSTQDVSHLIASVSDVSVQALEHVTDLMNQEFLVTYLKTDRAKKIRKLLEDQFK